MGCIVYNRFFKVHLERFLRLLFRSLFARELQGLKSEIERLDAEKASEKKRSIEIARALSGMNVGLAATPKGNWMVLAYSQGSQDYVKFYDFGGTNIIGLRKMVESYRKVGLAVLVENPFKPFPAKRDT